jgi:hypothetical protein
VSGIAARRPDNDDHPPLQATDGDDTPLAIVLSLVGKIEGHPGENLDRIDEVDLAFGKSLRSLCRIEGYPNHPLYVYTLIPPVNRCSKAA